MASKWHASKAFKKRLAKLPASVLKKTNEAIKKNAEEWVDWAQKMAPEDPKDGIHLRPSIRHEETETGGQIVRAGGEATRVKQINGTGTFDYAIGVEFGTSPHIAGGKFKGAMHPGTSAQPFFWPSYRMLRKRMSSRRRRALNQSVKDFNDGK
ncbi:HK97 gp10 family phage protein [Brucella intermedia]|uniref:HK97-gp10 family putative phage morphogenesis protein n=1 Tax=Brucella intermedia TaxID=94625 RepID=UPI00209BB3B8|nr:HK97-gp10 family putative phage morphogenesis protein [Brucella intermedia]MCO7736447.1 HK97 gp10 family phage protein [Brucella intermedia]